jgi:ElaB/YqjD/DUF883 family membrane-anchored ribosome-binding protein
VDGVHDTSTALVRLCYVNEIKAIVVWSSLREQALAALTLVADDPLDVNAHRSSKTYWYIQPNILRRILGTKDEVIGSEGPAGDIMNEHQYPSESTESGKDNLISAAGNLKEAAGAKAEDLRQAAGQKAHELRSAAQDKAQELRGAAESAWSGARSRAKSWHSEGEVYIRDNPTKALLIALGFGLLLGLSLRK